MNTQSAGLPACAPPWALRAAVSSRWALFLAVVLSASGRVHALAPESTAASTSTTRSVQHAPAPFNQLRHGMSPNDAVFVAGAPAQRLPGEVWIYWNCIDWRGNPAHQRLDTIVLRFANQQLCEIRLVEGKALRALLATPAAAAAVATVSPR